MSDKPTQNDQATPAAAPPQATRTHTPALRCPRAWFFLLALTAALLVFDLATKWAAFRFIADHPVHLDRSAALAYVQNAPHLLHELIPPHDPVVVIPSILEFKLVLNPGAVFGSGAGKRWFFISFTIAVLLFTLFVFARWTTPRDRAAHIAIALIISGGIGNLYDRIVYACVRDFLHPLPSVPLPFGIRWPNGSPELWPWVSNVADAYLIAGIAILMLWMWRTPTHHPKQPVTS